ncbi:MAG: hypothetical protein C0504_12910 [Candidatus Solibacter sp.]|nr:hypothetical protein [Candidatus Solibacter sp.]
MKVDYTPRSEVSPEAAKAATGRTLEQWYGVLDAKGGASEGRRVLTEYLFRQLKVDAWWTTTIIVEYEKARGIAEKDGLPKGYNICVTKALTVTPERAVDEFADGSWWLGKGAKVVEGGTFDAGGGHKGRFKKVTPGKLIRFTWEGPGHAPVEVIDIKAIVTAGKTSLTINHDRLQSRDTADGMREAWAKVLNELKDRLS